MEINENGETVQPPRKRRKIIIHSSPYKRCIHTSIAIAAGLRYPQPDRLRPPPSAFQRSSLSHQRAPVTTTTSNSDPARSVPDGEVAEKNEKNDKPVLKLDPFLAEWLSPSYFEDSKSPPPMDVITERAVETLTKPLKEIRGADLSAFLPVPESPEAEKEIDFKLAAQEKGGLRAMAAAGHSLPHRTRTTSFGVDRPNGVNQLVVQKARRRARTTNVYSPPVPQYSLAPHDSIPPGYVAHAREACLQPDLAWNSEEMGWGDAGSYPEEWSAMHVRFRLGLQKMLNYYQEYQFDQNTTEDEDENVDEDIILVLVTHQAGANALIRLVTGAPALHDVGVASLTLAVRRPVLRRLPSLTGTSHSPLAFDREARKPSRRGSLDLGLANDFEMRIIASTEHLRNGSNPLGLNSPRLGKSPAMASRRMVGPDSLEGFSIGDSLTWRSSSGSNLPRSTSQRGRNTEASSRSTTGSGLWGSPAVSAAAKEPIEERIEDLPQMSPRSRPTTPNVEAEAENVSESKLSSPTRSRSSTVQSAGLWGSNNATLNVRSSSGESSMWGGSGPGSGSVSRARSPAKRRWQSVSNSP